MPEITGLQFINTLKNPPAIILTTAFRDFAPEAFDLDVVDYLLKPISFERLLKSVNKFFDRKANSISANIGFENQETFLHVKADRKVHKIPVSDVLYIESLDDYVKVHLKEKIIVTRENISTLEEKLPRNLFDIKISKKLGKHFSTSFTVRDIFNAPVIRAYGKEKGSKLSYDKFTWGTNYLFSISYKI